MVNGFHVFTCESQRMQKKKIQCMNKYDKRNSKKERKMIDGDILIKNFWAIAYSTQSSELPKLKLYVPRLKLILVK